MFCRGVWADTDTAFDGQAYKFGNSMLHVVWLAISARLQIEARLVVLLDCDFRRGVWASNIDAAADLVFYVIAASIRINFAGSCGDVVLKAVLCRAPALTAPMDST
jgi:hypothetical protein